MYITNEELEVMKKVITRAKLFLAKKDVNSYTSIVERFEKSKEKRNKYAAEYMNKKRKNDKTYGQSYERKIKILFG